MNESTDFDCPFCGAKCHVSAEGFDVEGEPKRIPAVLHASPPCPVFTQADDALDFMEIASAHMLATGPVRGHA
jgi:hypothetical protein